MSTTRIGGTIEQMTAMGTKFGTEADTIGDLASRITTQLNSTDWTGGAAQRFRAQWNGEFKGVFTKVETGLRECGSEVKKRATALTQADA
jgi:WXG100 family type VII secretion target